jgi:WD40 repeat protein
VYLDGGTEIRDLVTGGITRRVDTPEEIPYANNLIHSPDGSIFATGHHDGTMRVWDSATGDTVKDIGKEDTDTITSVLFSLDESRIIPRVHDNVIMGAVEATSLGWPFNQTLDMVDSGTDVNGGERDSL